MTTKNEVVMCEETAPLRVKLKNIPYLLSHANILALSLVITFVKYFLLVFIIAVACLLLSTDLRVLVQMVMG